MVLGGERLSYRTLDVEQIGSVYEAIMGFQIERSSGRSIGIRSPKNSGAAVVVNLEHLLDLAGTQRTSAFKNHTDRKLTGKAASGFRKASTVEDMVAALDRVIDRDATPDVIPPEVPILQPTNERRRSGSHYTPRSLTKPIVAEALRPVLERLGEHASPEDILSIKVLDPATGSGAFLVEACRQLASHLVDAWRNHGGAPEELVDEDELLHARRLVAQQCLYGVDRNPMAIDLARLSLWLVTLARNHEFTFIDHALRHGDSLVGLTRRQIKAFNWDVNTKRKQLGIELGLEAEEVTKALEQVAEMRRMIQKLGGEIPEQELQDLMNEMDHTLSRIRQIADLVLLAFFEGKKANERRDNLAKYADMIVDRNQAEDLANAAARLPVKSFHWEMEFPEVFDRKNRKNPGFDTIIGNPPFAGNDTISASHPSSYSDWLKELHTQSHGNADLAAHFFRRTFNLLRKNGSLGLIATNTIGQGDTRSTGLSWICENGGEIYRAQRRFKWPGEAAVIVSVLHIIRGKYRGQRFLDGKKVDIITAFLFYRGGHRDPKTLQENSRKSFQGNTLRGMGFTFDDTDNKGVASPISEMERLISENPCNQDVIFPYVGGKEVNTSPVHAHHRYVINFRDWPLCRADLGKTWMDADADECHGWLRNGIVPMDYQGPVAADWPELLAIIRTKVKPIRDKLFLTNPNSRLVQPWWQFWGYRKGLHEAITGLDQVLAIARVTSYVQFTILSSSQIFSDAIILFPIPTFAGFCTLQAHPHEIWARFFGSSLKDDLRYTPSDCFETFPFPKDWETLPALEAVGEAYYKFRAELMVKNNEGMTKTYNRFHNPEEHGSQFAELRKLHAAMDRAVLDAYGWTDIPTDCEFLLDYEIDETTWGNKKKPYRYRWPDDVHDEVLARLLALNAKYAEEELIACKIKNGS